MVLGKLDKNMQKLKLDHFFTFHTRINSKFSKNFNVRFRTIYLSLHNVSVRLIRLAEDNEAWIN